MAHATLAQLFFITILSLAFFTSDWWQSDLDRHDDTGSPSLKSLAVATSASIVLQTVLGAGFRHGAFSIVPHFIGAALVTVMVVWTGRAVRKRFHDVRPLRKSVIFLHATFGTQILLGGLTYWVVLGAHNAPQPLPLYITVTVAHVVMGALTLASSMAVTLISFRLLRPSRAVEVSSSTERAAI